MGYFDYTREPRSDIAFIDMKSFYASVECVERGLHPLKIQNSCDSLKIGQK